MCKHLDWVFETIWIFDLQWIKSILHHHHHRYTFLSHFIFFLSLIEMYDKFTMFSDFSSTLNYQILVCFILTPNIVFFHKEWTIKEKINWRESRTRVKKNIIKLIAWDFIRWINLCVCVFFILLHQNQLITSDYLTKMRFTCRPKKRSNAWKICV